MFKKAWNYLLSKLKIFDKKHSPEESSVGQNAARVGVLLTISRVLGIVREVVISRFVDRNYQDLLSIADKIPSIIKRLSGEGILDYAYIPPLSEFDKDKEAKEANRWLSTTCGMFVTLVLLMIYVAIATQSFWATGLLKSYTDPDSLKIFTDFFNIKAPMCVFYFLSSVFIAILLRYEVFVHSHIGQPIANIFQIITLLIGYQLTESYLVVALSAVVGAVAHIIWQYYGARKISRDKFKSRFFPDLFAKILTLFLGSLFLKVGMFYIFEQSPLKALLPFKMPDQVTQWIFATIIFGASLFAATIFFMRKRSGDGTLEYGSFREGKRSLVEKINFDSYASLICLMIVKKLSFLLPFANWIELISSGLVIVFCVSGILLPEAKKAYLFRTKNHFKFLFAYTLSVAILSLFVPWCKHVFLISVMLSNLIKIYLDNFMSGKLEERINKINSNFIQNFSNAFFGVGINQIMGLVGIVVAAKIGQGAPSYIARSDRILQGPINLIAVPFGLVLLPRLSKFIKENKKDEAQITYDKAITMSLALSIVGVILCLILAKPLGNIFLGGKTSMADVSVISSLFRIEVFGLPAYVLSKVLSAVYFATKNSKIMFHAAIAQCVVSVPLKLMAWKLGLGLQFLPLASIAGIWTNAIYLLLNHNDSIDLFHPIKKLFQPGQAAGPASAELKEIEKEKEKDEQGVGEEDVRQIIDLNSTEDDDLKV